MVNRAEKTLTRAIPELVPVDVPFDVLWEGSEATVKGWWTAGCCSRPRQPTSFNEPLCLDAVGCFDRVETAGREREKTDGVLW